MSFKAVSWLLGRGGKHASRATQGVSCRVSYLWIAFPCSASALLQTSQTSSAGRVTPRRRLSGSAGLPAKCLGRNGLPTLLIRCAAIASKFANYPDCDKRSSGTSHHRNIARLHKHCHTHAVSLGRGRSMKIACLSVVIPSFLTSKATPVQGAKTQKEI